MAPRSTAERFVSSKTDPGLSAAALTPAVAADPDLVPGAAGPAKAEVAVRAAVAAAPTPGQRLALEAVLEAKRATRAKVKKRKRSAAAELRRTTTTAGAEAPKTRRARKTGRRARRTLPTQGPGPALGPGPGLAPDPGTRIAPRSPSQRIGILPRSTTMEVKQTGCPAHVHTRLSSRSLDPGLNPSLNLTPLPRPKPALFPVPHPVLYPAPNPVPSPVPYPVLAPVPALRPRLGLSYPYVSTRPSKWTPVRVFLINSCRKPGVPCLLCITSH